jgi:hypothetical protein
MSSCLAVFLAVFEMARNRWGQMLSGHPLRQYIPVNL